MADEGGLVGPVAEPGVPPVAVGGVDGDAHAQLGVLVVVRPHLAAVAPVAEVVAQGGRGGVVTVKEKGF